MLIFVNGNQAKETYKLCEGDICTIRKYPSATAVAITIGVLAIGAGVAYFGKGLAQSITKKRLSETLKAKQNTVDDVTTHPSINGSENAPCVGRAVPLILGKTYLSPYYVGNGKTNGYVEIKGVDGVHERYTNLYVLGYKDLRVRDVKLGYYTLSSNDGVTKGVLASKNYDENQYVTTEVSNGELPLNFESKTSRYNPKDYGIKLELRQDGNEVSLFNQKVVQTVLNYELLCQDNKPVDCYAFSATYPQKIEIEFTLPNGLLGYNKESGEKENATVDIGLQMSIDGGNSWISIKNGNYARYGLNLDEGYTGTITQSESSLLNGGTGWKMSFTNKKAETMRYVCVIEFNSYEQVKNIVNNVVEFKITREKNNSDDTSTRDNVYVTRIRTWCYDKNATKKQFEESGSTKLIPLRPIGNKLKNKTTRLGFQIYAKDEISDQLKKINAVLTSKCRIWNKETKEWSQDKHPTNNPAALALHVMTDEYRGIYAYDDSKIDYDSFGEFYEWCDEDFNFGSVAGVMKRFTCDGVVLNGQKTFEIVNQILSCGRGFLTTVMNKYAVVIDKPRTQVVHILNNQNILKRNNSKTFDEPYDAINAKFINAMLENQEDYVLISPNDVEITEDSRILNAEFPFINNPYRAKCMGLYNLAIQKHRPEVWDAKLSVDGNLIEVGNLIEIQDDTILVGIGDGAEITGLIFDDEEYPTELIGVETDGVFPVNDKFEAYAIKTVKYYDTVDGSTPIKLVKTVKAEEEGNYSTFYFDIPISLNDRYFEIGDIISFGIYQKETAKAICAEKNDNGDGTFDFSFIPYSEDIYNADSGDLGEYNSNVTPPQLQEIKMRDENNGKDGVDGANGMSTWYSIANATENTTEITLDSIIKVDNKNVQVGDLVIAKSIIFVINEINQNSVFVQSYESIKGEQGIQGEKGDTGATGPQGATGPRGATGAQGQRGNLEFSGTEIDHIGTTDKAYTITTASNGITSSSMQILVGDTYINTTSQDAWTCTTAGTPTTAKWKHTGRRKIDADNTNIFRLFTPTTDYGTLSGSTLSKQIVKGLNPFGETSDLLKITNTNGIAGSYYSPNNKQHKIDPKKTYRHVTYIKQEDANYTDFIGIARWETENSFCLSISGSPTHAAYFTSATNFENLGRWYMVVGYIVANGTTTAPADSGVYDMVTKQKIRSVTNYQWKPNATYCDNNGCLIRYTSGASATTGTAYLYDIRLDEIDGTELSLDNLLYGTTSQRGAIYKGALSTPPTTDIVIGDWYLNTTDNVIHWYNGSNWNNTVTDYKDYRYKPALNDMLAIAAEKPTVGFIAIVTAHIQNLAAGNILANEIATQTLELKDDGVIKSDNYVEGESGFIIESDGNVEFNKGRFRGGIGTELITSYNNTGYINKVCELPFKMYDKDELKIFSVTIFAHTTSPVNDSFPVGSFEICCSNIVSNSEYSIRANGYFYDKNLYEFKTYIDEDKIYKFEFTYISTEEKPRIRFLINIMEF